MHLLQDLDTWVLDLIGNKLGITKYISYLYKRKNKTMKNHIVKTEEYFKFFQDKDLIKLENTYAFNIRLTDWIVDVMGKNEVLSSNKELFENDFKLEVISTKQIDNQTYNEITIEIGDEFLNILDVITFNDDFEIENITAYKR